MEVWMHMEEALAVSPRTGARDWDSRSLEKDP